jgi:hypothetical protein
MKRAVQSETPDNFFIGVWVHLREHWHGPSYCQGGSEVDCSWHLSCVKGKQTSHGVGLEFRSVQVQLWRSF